MKKKTSIYRFHLKDDGQDMLYIDVESTDGDMGMIVGVNDGAAYHNAYKDKAFDFSDNPVGSQFNCADPMNGFKIFRSKWTIESIEKLSVSPYGLAPVGDAQQLGQTATPLQQ